MLACLHNATATQKNNRELLPEGWCRELLPAHKCRITIRMLFLELTNVRELLRYKQLPRAHERALTFSLKGM
jgi:hypothetical protein